MSELVARPAWRCASRKCGYLFFRVVAQITTGRWIDGSIITCSSNACPLLTLSGGGARLRKTRGVCVEINEWIFAHIHSPDQSLSPQKRGHDWIGEVLCKYQRTAVGVPPPPFGSEAIGFLLLWGRRTEKRRPSGERDLVVTLFFCPQLCTSLYAALHYRTVE